MDTYYVFKYDSGVLDVIDTLDKCVTGAWRANYCINDTERYFYMGSDVPPPYEAVTIIKNAIIDNETLCAMRLYGTYIGKIEYHEMSTALKSRFEF